MQFDIEWLQSSPHTKKKTSALNYIRSEMVVVNLIPANHIHLT